MSSTNDPTSPDPRDDDALAPLPPADPTAVLAELAEVEYDAEHGAAPARPTLAAAAHLAAENYAGTPDHEALVHHSAPVTESIEVPVVGTREPVARPPAVNDDDTLSSGLHSGDPTQVLGVVAERDYDQTSEPSAEDSKPRVTPGTAAAAAALAQRPAERSAGPTLDYTTDVVVPVFRPLRLLSRLAPFESVAGRWGGWAVAGVVTLLYFGLLLAYWAPAHPGVDQNGYLAGGRYLATTGSTGFTPSDPFGWVGNMYVMSRHNGVIQDFPKYPIGLSLLYACFLWTFGTAQGSAGYVWAFLVSPIGAAAGVLGTYAIVRLFASNFAAVCALLLIAFSQVVLTLANNPNSHASCLGFVVWGGYLLIRYWQTGSIWRGLGAGFLLGFAVTIRYTEGLLALLIAWTAMTMWDWRGRAGVIGAGLIAAGVGMKTAALKTLEGFVWLEWLKAGEPETMLATPTGRIVVLALGGACVLGGVACVAWWAGRYRYRALARNFLLGWPVRLATFAVAGAGALALFWFVARHQASTPRWVGFTGLSAVLALVALAAVVAPLFSRGVWLNFLRGWAPTLGWAVPVGYLVGFNKIAMGTWTGYDTTNESTGFTLKDFYENWERAVRQIHDTGLFFVLPIGLLGMVLLFRRSTRLAVMMWLWFVPGTLLYIAYYWAPERGVAYLRFFMTLFPPLVIGAGYTLYAVGEHLVGVRRTLVETGPVDRAAYDRVGGATTVVAQEFPVRGSKRMLLTRLAMIAAAVASVPLVLWYAQWKTPTLHVDFFRIVLSAAVLGVVSAAAAVAFTRRERDTAVTAALPPGEWRGAFGRAAVGALAGGAVVFAATGIGLYRSLTGLEDGSMSGMSIENAQRSNNNLAQLGQLVVSRVPIDLGPDNTDPEKPAKRAYAFGLPAGSTVFARDNELHYLQFMGDFNFFSVDAFNNRFSQRLSSRGPTAEDPNPLQGERLAYLNEIYRGKSDRDLVVVQNGLMDKAFAAGRRVFVVTDRGSADTFKARFIKGAKYQARTLAQCRDVARILTPELANPDNQRAGRRMAMGGRGPGAPGSAWGDEARVWQVIEITPAPASTRPTTAPTTRPARRGRPV